MQPQQPQQLQQPTTTNNNQQQPTTTDNNTNNTTNTNNTWLNVSSLLRPGRNGTRHPDKICRLESSSRQQRPALHQRPTQEAQEVLQQVRGVSTSSFHLQHQRPR